MPGERAVEKSRRRLGVRRGELAVVEGDDPRAEAEAGAVAGLAKAQQRLRGGAGRHERAVAAPLGLEVERAPGQHADAAVPWQDAAGPVVGDGDGDGVAAQLEHLGGELVGADVVELLGVEEHLDAAVHAENRRRSSSLGSTPSPGPPGSRATTPSISSGSASVESSS